jgi:transposase
MGKRQSRPWIVSDELWSLIEPLLPEPAPKLAEGIRRLRIRWERRDVIHEAFLGLAVCLITHRHVQRLC